jgi:hypothetical protein
MVSVPDNYQAFAITVPLQRKETPAFFQVEQLMQSKQQLEEVIRSKFAEAVERKDHAQAVRFAKLYPPLQVGRQPGVSHA